ncbi:hypothetical protein WN943_003527 [Citrus x changshan-huyou]
MIFPLLLRVSSLAFASLYGMLKAISTSGLLYFLLILCDKLLIFFKLPLYNNWPCILQNFCTQCARIFNSIWSPILIVGSFCNSWFMLSCLISILQKEFSFFS